MKNFPVCAGAALAACLCAFSVAQEAQPSTPAPKTPLAASVAITPPKGVEPMAICAATPEVQNMVLEGMTHLLTFGDMQAYYKFAQAIEKDPDCLMAHWGLCMSLLGAGPEFWQQRAQSLKILKELAGRDNCVGHEREYANVLALMLTKGMAEARQACKVMTETRKQDGYATLLYAMMTRDGYEADGKAKAGQQLAIDTVDQLLKKNPQHHAALFMRALLEETAPVVSSAAVDAARKAVATNPDSIAARQLLGHIQFRTGNYSGAAYSFEKAAQLSEQWEKLNSVPRALNESWFRAGVYRAVAEFCHGNYDKAEKLAKELNKVPLDKAHPLAPGTIMQLWEVRWLPVRLMLARPVLPKHEDVLMACPGPQPKEFPDMSNGMKAVVSLYMSAKYAQRQGKPELITEAYDKLSAVVRMMVEGQEEAAKQMSLSYSQRCLQLANLYAAEIRAASFPDTAMFWLENAVNAQRYSSLLLPPVLPYPAELKMAEAHLKAGKNEECLDMCEKALKRFPYQTEVLEAMHAAGKNKKTDSQPQTKQYNMEHPYLTDSFMIPWSRLTPECIKADTTLAIEHGNAKIESICRLTPEHMTYENTFGAMEEVPAEVERAWGRVMHLSSTMDSPELRKSMAEMMPEVITFMSSVALNPRLWEVLKEASQQPWVKNLSPVKQRFIKETLADFIASGADLPDELKPEFAEIEATLSMKSKKFGENVLDATNAWEIIVKDKAELAGLPESALEAARLDALANGHGTEEAPCWRFTQQYPSMSPVMQFADSDELRHKVWEGSQSIGNKGTKFDNEGIVNEILDLRDRKAKMLGFDNYGNFNTSRRMVGSGTNALKFIEDLHDKVKDAFLADMEAIRKYKEEKTGKPVDKLHPWETYYYAEKRRKELFDFEMEELRPYFSVQNVMDGMFAIYSHLYGIKVTPRKTVAFEPGKPGEIPEGAVEVWHPEVSFYEVHDEKTGEHLGSFYADWYPRDTKRGGAWMNCLIVGEPATAGSPRKPHLGLIAGNMTKPVGDKPALLTHMEVETIFHEFGHLLHQLLSNVEVKALAGTAVAWDFVELPSQINENWCWERESLDMFARHYETGEKIPEELFNKMLAARNYDGGNFFMRQLGFGKLDMELHVNWDKYRGKTLEEIDEMILHDYRIPMSVNPPSLARRMSHLFSGGYGAGYYSYKWAEQLEADAFSRFKKEGVLNKKTGADFRRCILEKGNSKPAAELFRDFMGRDPDAEAMLRKTGIIK